MAKTEAQATKEAQAEFDAKTEPMTTSWNGEVKEFSKQQNDDWIVQRTQEILYEANDKWAQDRKDNYPALVDFVEAYTEKEILSDSTKWDAYETAYKKVRTDNPKPS